MVSLKMHARGFSLVEVLVSVVVLSLGLLGAASLLMASVRGSNEAAAFTAGLDLVRELSEKVRMNRAVAGARGSGNAYLVDDWRASGGAELEAVDCASATRSCSASELARWDIGEWKRRVAAALPEARASVCFDEAPGSAATWACSHSGDRLVVKLGWASRADPPVSSPRLVMQLGAVQGRDDHARA